MTSRRLELTGPGFVKDVKRPLSTAGLLAGVVPRAFTKRQGELTQNYPPEPITARREGVRWGQDTYQPYPV